MDRLSLKRTYLTPVRIASRLHWLLVCLCLIPLTGCMVATTPYTYNLDIHDDAPLPDLSLVRRVVPEVGTRTGTEMARTVDVVSESRFGDPGDEADLSCVYAGLKEALPDIEIVPTTNFWEQVTAPHDVIKLSDLFVAPQSVRLQALQADVIVIAHHSEIDLESQGMFVLISANYSTTVKKTAAIIVIDLRRKATLHGSKISFRDHSNIGYHLFIPYLEGTSPPPDICNTVGHQAGAAIAETMPGRAVRTLVVVAGEDPYEASRMSIH
jgi:hypothetical protein